MEAHVVHRRKLNEVAIGYLHKTQRRKDEKDEKEDDRDREREKKKKKGVRI